MDFASIGKNIRKVRKDQKKRQEDIAEAAGISVTYYGTIERGEKTPSLEILINIINTLGVSADVILCDVIDADYEIRYSLVGDKLEGLSRDNVALVSDIIDAVKNTANNLILQSFIHSKEKTQSIPLRQQLPKK